MKTNIDIMEYSKRLFAADNSAAVWLEEDFDPACDYTWSAAGDSWADEFRATLKEYIPQCEDAAKRFPKPDPDSEGAYYWVDYAKRAADYKQALAILDEMEQAAAEQPQTSTPDYTALAATLTAELNARHDRSAWSKAVTWYALTLLDDIQDHADDMERLPLDGTELEQWALNGASCWEQYSNGGCALCYNRDIAARVCNPSEFRRSDGGMNAPNSRETWLDVQARALYQACNRLRKICRSNSLYCKGVQ